jgi:dihydroorotase
MSAASTPVRVVADGAITAARLSEEPGRVHIVNADDDADRDVELFISPGWADLHTHVYDGVTQISVHPDRVGLDTGVHVLGDAGSAGQATLRGLLDYVLPQARTEVRVWLNIGSHGLVHLREVADPQFIDVDATLAAIAAHRNAICGVKVRSSGLIVGAMGLTPLQLGRLVAREARLPLLVHIGEAPPLIDDVLDLLDAGDVITHCFHGKTGYPWTRTGAPGPALARARERGVLLDVGHGAASFDLGVARRAVQAGHLPDSISTDIHVRNIDGPVHSLAAVMTKLHAAGMPLAEVVRAVTATPRAILGADRPWRGADGAVEHATIFRVTADPPTGLANRADAGAPFEPARHIVPVAVVVAGRCQKVGR